ncbi:ATP-dependent DNA helicase [Chitinasiproducens palmae]|nr:ATP-dependent DNA helicase [Chitinasiproducens palmae]
MALAIAAAIEASTPPALGRVRATSGYGSDPRDEAEDDRDAAMDGASDTGSHTASDTQLDDGANGLAGEGGEPGGRAGAEQGRGGNRAADPVEGDGPVRSGALDDGNTLIVEAGTGTGKTFAYLVPALRWGGKVIVSTGTKHLQDQLFARDVPTVRDALAAPVAVALLKGRSNYLCLHYLQRTADGARLPSRQDAHHLSEIVRFSKVTQSGDKAELASVPENAPIWSMVTSTRDNCLGQECEHYKKCYVMLARREAQQADVVVVNHHLFFADIRLRDSGMAELLPSANTVIFDEAHQLPETATLFFGETISTGQLLELARDTLTEGLAFARDAGDWRDLTTALEQRVRDLRLAFGAGNLRASLEQLGDAHPFHEALDALEDALDDLADLTMQQAARAESLDNCAKRARKLQDGLARWRAGVAAAEVEEGADDAGRDLLAAATASKEGWSLQNAEDVARLEAQRAKAQAQREADRAKRGDDAAPETVRWLEVFSQAVQLHQTPLSVAPIFRRQRRGPPRAWIFTSATLSVKQDFSHYAAQMGLDATRSMTLPSPFDYARQGLLYVPKGLPQPSSPDYMDAVLAASLPLIEASRGRAFVLCTTLRAVERLSESLRQALLAKGLTFPLLKQGDASRTELLDRFRALGNAVLVGSQSFWEGVDVRGDALSLVIIDKLPFASPDDPVLAARLDALAKRGLSPFAVHQLPQAVITLKQGAGRLIRSESDRGVLMICDPRLVDKPYGRRIWQSLPPFSRSRDETLVKAFLEDEASAQG